MTFKAEKKPSTIVGISNIHVAQQLTEGDAKTKPTYDKPLPVLGTVSLEIGLNASIESFYADNIVFEGSSSQSDTDVTWEKAGLDQQMQEYILGRFVDASGMIIQSSSQEPPVVALLGEKLHANGKRERFCIYQVRFPESNETGQTKADGVEFGTFTMEGKGTETLYQATFVSPFSNKTKKAGLKIGRVMEGDEIFDQDVFDEWFDEVPFPTGVTPTTTP